MRLLAGRIEREHTRVGEARDPAFIERQVGRVRALTGYFSPEVRGIEHLPAGGPPC